MRESPRIRRLRTDLKALEALKADSNILEFEPHGNPPKEYLIRFLGKGLRRDLDEKVVIQEKHEVLVNLGASYPRVMPGMRWKTPLFHPNISASGAVCLGGYGTYWVPSLNLDELCEMLWEMIRYANFDITSPYNRDASEWAKYQREYRLPVDPRPIRDKVAGEQPSPEPATAEDILFLGEAEATAGPATEPEPPDLLIIE